PSGNAELTLAYWATLPLNDSITTLSDESSDWFKLVCRCIMRDRSAKGRFVSHVHFCGPFTMVRLVPLMSSIVGAGSTVHSYSTAMSTIADSIASHISARSLSVTACVAGDLINRNPTAEIRTHDMCAAL